MDTLNVFALYNFYSWNGFELYEQGVWACSMRSGCHCQWEEWREAAVGDSWVSLTWLRSLGPEFHTSLPAGRIWEHLKGKMQRLKWHHFICVCMFACSISPSPSLLKPYALMTSCWIWVATGSTSCSILPMSLQALSLASSMRAAFSGTEKAWITSLRTTAIDGRNGKTVWLSPSSVLVVNKNYDKKNNRLFLTSLHKLPCLGLPDVKILHPPIRTFFLNW